MRVWALNFSQYLFSLSIFLMPSTMALWLLIAFKCSPLPRRVKGAKVAIHLESQFERLYRPRAGPRPIISITIVGANCVVQWWHYTIRETETHTQKQVRWDTQRGLVVAYCSLRFDPIHSVRGVAGWDWGNKRRSIDMCTHSFAWLVQKNVEMLMNKGPRLDSKKSQIMLLYPLS